MPSREWYTFPESYDRTTKIISACICAGYVAGAVATRSPIVTVLGAAVLALAYAYSPRACAVSNRAILVKRLIGSVHFPLEDVREARAATAADLRGCMRLWASGGLFGYYGLFRTAKLGKCPWYVTNRRNAVVVVTGAKTAVFSPDNVDGFLEAIRAAAPVPEVSGDELILAPPQPPPAAGRLAGILLASTTGLVVLTIVALAFLYSPGPPSYTLTPNSLTINDRFYPVTLNAGSVDVEHIRVVDIRNDPEWRPTGRTNGFANSHYHSGWFRVSSGRQIRMYRAEGTRLVLLPPNGDHAPVLLDTRDPEKFMAEVQQAWANP